MKHKKMFIAFTVIFSILLALAIFIMIWYWGDRYNDFDDFRSEVAIPGLKDGACPQGITVYKTNYKTTETDEKGEEKEVTKTQNYFFITAYFKDKASRIYVVGDETGEVGYVTLKNEDGSDHTGHVGGIATNGRYIWVCSGHTIYVANKDNSTNTNNVAIDVIKTAEDHGSLQFKTSFNANCNAAFLYYYDADQNGAAGTPSSTDRLYVGEFYRSGNYETDELHHLTTPNGETNKAFVYEYNVSVSSNYGLDTLTNSKDKNDNPAPKIQKIFSIPNKIQGFARTDKGLVLSESYGLSNSHIYYHEFNWSNLSENSTRVKYSSINRQGSKYFEYKDVTTTSGAPYYVNGTITTDDLYVYYIDGSTMLNDYSIPSMSEGLCTIGDRVYILFESGAKKYSTFVRQVHTNVYSFVPRSKH